ncbi:MAG: hypothetical protein A3C06_01085 [Candidatus Taylorbacteria bacterium RIFCSPHIGHO2_02_FULL_46_13]|uniref:DUF1761 domain-containing protein n=1 Tax=Candidatus Taylorbacteria bacterium RIFCSPHIGHO2_02_FULL_46_13 TaxID=1802312 RepID=A0A1G2MT95_9BACT|nr:MAG: hypothetical protein A3C06_01085 [Candidatus Taylorbacteria bacterium RIFCSPHIGHO2_02_FULL_46_13]
MSFALNYWAVLVAGVASMVIGSFWYGPLFGKIWVPLMGFSQEQMKAAQAKGMAKSYALALVGGLVTAAVIAILVSKLGITDVQGAGKLVFTLWVGFIATTLLSTVLWENRPWKLYFINIFYYLVLFFVQAVILTYWV